MNNSKRMIEKKKKEKKLPGLGSEPLTQPYQCDTPIFG